MTPEEEQEFLERLARVAAHDPEALARFLSLHPADERDGGPEDTQRASYLVRTWIAETPRHTPRMFTGGEAGVDRGADGLDPASRVARYQHRERIARGGMGDVVEVWDAVFLRSLAMKVIRPDLRNQQGSDPSAYRELRARFIEEAQVTGQLEHPGIVPVHDMGTDEEGCPYFTMRLVRGADLGEVLYKMSADLDGWALPRALSTLLRVCEAVSYAHSRGVVHRDLKPANIMVGPFGEVYVMDWGLARVRGRSPSYDVAQPGKESIRTDRRSHRERLPASPLVTTDGSVLGTPAYMAPEQARGQLEAVDERCDIYAVGAILYHMLAGHAPYQDGGPRDARETLELVIGGPPSPIRVSRSVPAELESICDKAMARRKEDRYESMEELAGELRAYLEVRVVAAHRTGPIAELRKWVTRNRLAARIAVGAAVVLALVVAFSFVRLSRERGIADKAADEAIRQESIARAQRDVAETARADAVTSLLGAEAFRLEQRDPALAIRLALEADARRPTADIRSLMARASRGFVEEHAFVFDGAVRSMATSPAGLALIGGVGYVATIDVLAGKTLDVMPLNTGEAALAVTFGPRPRAIVAALPPPPSLDHEVSVSRVVVATRIVDIASGGVVSDLGDIGEEPVTLAEFDDTGRYALVGRRGRVERIEVGVGRSAGSIDLPFDWSSFGAVALLMRQGGPSHLKGSVTPTSGTFAGAGPEVLVVADDYVVRCWDPTSADAPILIPLPLGDTDPQAGASLALAGVGLGPRVLCVVGEDRVRLGNANSQYLDIDLDSLATDGVWDSPAGPMSGLAALPDGSLVAAGFLDGRVVLWRGSDASEPWLWLRGHTSSVVSLAWLDGGRRLVTGAVAGDVRVWDLDRRDRYGSDAGLAALVPRHMTDALLGTVPDMQTVVAMSSDFEWVARAEDRGMTLAPLDAKTPVRVVTVASESNVSISDNGRTLAAFRNLRGSGRAREWSVHVVDVDRDATVLTLAAKGESIQSVALDSAGSWVGLACQGEEAARVLLRSIDTGEEHVMRWSGAAPVALSIDASARRVWVTSMEGVEVLSFEGVREASCRSEWRASLTYGGTATGHRRIHGMGAMFSCDHRWVAVPGPGRITLLRADDLTEQATFDGSFAGFSPDGEWLLAWREEGRLEAWPCDPVREARSLSSRDLTRAERATYGIDRRH